MTTTTCIAPLTDGTTLCGAPATTARRVEDLVVAMCDAHAAELDAERAARRLDLWEDNAGGLYLVDRAAGTGWRGFEVAVKDDLPWRPVVGACVTFETDVPYFDDLGEGSAYEAMGEADVEALYEDTDNPNAPRMVASWERGAVTVHPGSIGASARWYLASDGDN